MTRIKTNSLITDYFRPAIAAGVSISFGLIILAAIVYAYGIENHIVAICGLAIAAFNQLILQTRFDKRFGFLTAQFPAVFALAFSPVLVAVELIIGVLLGTALAITIVECFIAAFKYDPPSKKKRHEQPIEFKRLDMDNIQPKQFILDTDSVVRPLEEVIARKGYRK